MDAQEPPSQARGPEFLQFGCDKSVRQRWPRGVPARVVWGYETHVFR